MLSLKILKSLVAIFPVSPFLYDYTVTTYSLNKTQFGYF